MSKPRSAAAKSTEPAGASISIFRTALAVALVVAGIGWVTFYLTAVTGDASPKWAADLGDWNFLIGFGAIFLGLMISANPGTPLGRGRGVVVGMLGCFGIGLLWIVVYYVTSQDGSVPLVRDLGNYNLLVGIGFMASGFVFATRWE